MGDFLASAGPVLAWVDLGSGLRLTYIDRYGME
jgi:hypothetical protein